MNQANRKKARSHTQKIKFQLIGYFNKQSNHPLTYTLKVRNISVVKTQDARRKTQDARLSISRLSISTPRIYCMHAFLHFTTVWLFSSPLPPPPSPLPFPLRCNKFGSRLHAPRSMLHAPCLPNYQFPPCTLQMILIPSSFHNRKLLGAHPQSNFPCMPYTR